MLRLWGLVGLLFVRTQAIHAQESPGFEKILDVSPDGKVAVRVSCGSEPADPDNIDPSLITAADLVSLPLKKVVMNMSEEGAPHQLIWSPGSKWIAFPCQTATAWLKPMFSSLRGGIHEA